MSISEYIRDQWVSIGISVLTCLASAAFMGFMGIGLPVIVAVEVILFFGLSLPFIYDCMRKKTYYDELEETWASLEEKTYLTSILKCPDFYEGKLLYEIISQSESCFNDEIAQKQQELMEHREYIQTWVHEIKTPIAVQELLIENNRNALTSSIEEETKKIEAYVEQMLYYAKSGSLESDYMIQPVSLKKLVSEVLKKNRKMLVGSGVLPKLQNLEYTVLADPKWMEFVLGQVVTNSAKYSDAGRSPCLTFGAEEKDGMVLLTVADNGIGIPEGDVSRVFRKGFTGENGRKFKKSTGMGLYLCRNLCEKMQVPIELHSRQGEGTEVTFRFKQAAREQTCPGVRGT